MIDYINKKARLIVNAHWRRFNAYSVVLCRRDSDSSRASVKEICESGRKTWATSQENPANQQSQETIELILLFTTTAIGPSTTQLKLKS